MSNHTTGPWHIQGYSRITQIVGRESELTGSSLVVCRMAETYDGNFDGNCRLIAAAPAMCIALQDCVSALDGAMDAKSKRALEYARSVLNTL